MIQRRRSLLSYVLGSILLQLFSTTTSNYSFLSLSVLKTVVSAVETDEVYKNDEDEFIRTEVMADEVYNNDEDDDILAEIMAEQKREEEELAQLQAEIQELEALKAQREEQSSRANSGSKTSSTGMGGRMNNMPGAKPGQFDKLEEDLRRKEAKVREARYAAGAKDRMDDDQRKLDEEAAAREAAYLAELDRIKNDEKKRKALKRQKAKDSAAVRKVIYASARDMHYGVLGFNPLCRWCPNIKLGPFTICAISASEIKKAFRTVARSVHPDKNRDGRAVEAFRLLEKSAELLGDATRRKEYDVKLRLKRADMIEGVSSKFGGVWRVIVEIVGWSKRVLGPLFLPVVTLLLIII